MVKHNNVVPNQHFHKKWANSSRGPLKVKVNLNQASKKKSRRLARATKAAAVAPRPTSLLRPVVRAQTQRYNTKARLGRGFTLAELAAAGLNKAYARTVGIAVDTRRTNKSQEGLDANVARLEEYKKNLVVFPRRAGPKNAKAGDSAPADCAKATQKTGTVQPLQRQPAAVVLADVPAKGTNTAYTQMRNARFENKLAGIRQAVQDRKKKE